MCIFHCLFIEQNKCKLIYKVGYPITKAGLKRAAEDTLATAAANRAANSPTDSSPGSPREPEDEPSNSNAALRGASRMTVQNKDKLRDQIQQLSERKTRAKALDRIPSRYGNISYIGSIQAYIYIYI